MWPAQRPGLTTQTPSVRSPGGVPPARRLGPAGCSLTMPPQNSAIHNESTHSA